MRVAFVENHVNFTIPLGTTWVAAMLRQGGHQAELFEIGSRPDDAVEGIRAFGADAVGFSVISGSHQGYERFARRLKERLPDVLTVWGGPHATFYPESVESPWVDAVCLGEGEDAMLDFADGFEREGRRLPTGVENFWVKRDGQVVRGPLRPRRRSLDALPFPARDLYFKFPSARDYALRAFMAHRGCPYKCTYCFNESYNVMYAATGDHKILNTRSPESVCREVLELKERVPVKMVSFMDDVFTINRAWTLNFARVYGRECRIPFKINARFDNLDEEVVGALAEAGLRFVTAGLESGDEDIRNKVMKRNMSEARIIEGARLIKKHGVRLTTENIMGVPGETLETALKTVRLNTRIQCDYPSASLFSPFPKLDMTRYAMETGYFDGNFDALEDNFFYNTVLKFPSERERRRIVNLRLFFILFVKHPWLIPFVRPLLGLTPNFLFRWISEFADGYYLWRLRRSVILGGTPPGRRCATRRAWCSA